MIATNKAVVRNQLMCSIDDTHCIIQKELARLRELKKAKIKIGSTGDLPPEPSTK